MDDARLGRPNISCKRLSTESSPSRTLVSEMMIMAGQIAAEYGEMPYQIPTSKYKHHRPPGRGRKTLLCIASLPLCRQVPAMPHRRLASSQLFTLRNHVNDNFAGLDFDKYCNAVQSWPCQRFPDQHPAALCRHESTPAAAVHKLGKGSDAPAKRNQMQCLRTAAAACSCAHAFMHAAHRALQLCQQLESLLTFKAG